ncbi:MAG: ketol-acid reductoisomerase, partial [Sphingomonadales bacterium]|nr:ketol-acid reductoisomerase [Sphingomonadales bacterium]
MRVFRDENADFGLIRARRIAIVGYGNQGHAHALNLRDSGVEEVAVALPEASASRAKAEQAGFLLMSVEQAAGWADIVTLAVPDELQAEIYAASLHEQLREGAALVFAHGLNIHFGLIEPRADLDVLLVAPKGPGSALRADYLAGKGMITLIGVGRDASGRAHDLALAYAAGLGSGRAGIIESSFRQETEADLFNEQTVLWGVIPDLIEAGYETLV